MILPAYPYRDSNPENLVPETSMYSVPSYGHTPGGIRTLKTCVLSAVRIPFRHGCINKPFFGFYTPDEIRTRTVAGLNRMPLPIALLGLNYVINRFVSLNRNSISFILLHFLKSTMRVPIPHLLLGKQIYFRYTNGAKSFSSGSNRDYYCLQGSRHAIRREKHRAYDRNRVCNLLITKQVLCLLSYVGMNLQEWESNPLSQRL